MFVCVCVFAPRAGDDKIANIITGVYEFPELPVSAVVSPVWSSGGAHYRLYFSLRALGKKINKNHLLLLHQPGIG